MSAPEAALRTLAWVPPALEVHNQAREDRNRKGGQHIRNDQCCRHRERERFEESAGHAGKEHERQEDEQGSQARTGKRRQELAPGGQYRVRRVSR